MDTTPTTQNNEEEKVVERPPYAKEYTKTTFRDFVAGITPNKRKKTIIGITIFYCIGFILIFRFVDHICNGIENNFPYNCVFFVPSIVSLIDILLDNKGKLYYDPLHTIPSKFINALYIAYPMIFIVLILSYLPEEFWNSQSLTELESIFVFLLIPLFFIEYIMIKIFFMMPGLHSYILNYMYIFYLKHKKSGYSDEQIITLFDSMEHDFSEHPLYYISKKICGT